MTTPAQDTTVTSEVVVNAPIERAFEVFTTDHPADEGVDPNEQAELGQVRLDSQPRRAAALGRRVHRPVVSGP